MPRRFSTAEVLKALGGIGITPVRQRGSHIQLRGTYQGRFRAVTVPADRQSIDPRTMGSILRQAGLIQEQLEQLIDS